MLPIAGEVRMALIFGTNQSDTISAENTDVDGHDLIIAKNGDDSISAGMGCDLIFGGNGRDEIDGGSGGDALFGGNGADTLSGGEGNDKLFGGRGDDSISGGVGSDKLVGGRGDDTMDGGDGRDFVFGGRGDDIGIFRVSSEPNGFEIYDGGKGCDTLVLELTAEQATSEAFLAELAAYNTLIAGSRGHHWNPYFKFESIGLKARNWENVEVVIVGCESACKIDPLRWVFSV